MSDLLLSLKEIKELMQEVADKDIESLEIKQDDFKLKITANSAIPQTVVTMPQNNEQISLNVAQPTIIEAPATHEVSGNIVKSPIVGTFYQSPTPEKPPYVKVGDTVKVGDVLCIVESMKLMNEVLSEHSGTVTQLLVANEAPVEYGQPIMVIE